MPTGPAHWILQASVSDIIARLPDSRSLEGIGLCMFLALASVWWALPNLPGIAGRTNHPVPLDHASVDILVTLVHGTWSRGFLSVLRGLPATWVSDRRGRLRTRVDESLQGYRVRYHYFHWTGRNTTWARRRAAQRLARDLEGITRSSAGRVRHILIAHSHGGNVALRALRIADRPTRAAVLGLACLSTPFLHAVYYKDLDRLQLRSGLLLVAICLATFPFAALWLSGMSVAKLQELALVGLGAKAPLANWLAVLPLFAWVLYWAQERALLRRAIERVRDLRMRPLPRKEQLLIIRSIGDEAILALGAAQLFAWTSRLLLPITLGFARYGLAFATLGVVTVGALAGLLAAVGGEPGAVEEWFRHIVREFPNATTLFGWAVVLQPLTLAAAAVLFMSQHTGVLSALVSPFIDMNAEASPPGKWQVINLKPNGRGLDHSTYSHPMTARILAAWIQGLTRGVASAASPMPVATTLGGGSAGGSAGSAG